MPKYLLASLLFASNALLAAAPPAAPEAAMRVSCESIAERWQQCPLPFSGEAVLLRQLSRNPCVRNHSWGQDEGGIWVARGCRGEFGPRESAEAEDRGQWHALRCDSRSAQAVRCPVDTRGGVRLTRQLSSLPCELGRSWGFDDTAIWVSRGCRAEFAVRAEQAASPGLWQRLWHRDRSKAETAEALAPRSIKCESRDGARKECRLQGQGQVLLLQQLSKAPCVQNQSWGFDAEKVWVEAGCRAEFMLWTQHD